MKNVAIIIENAVKLVENVVNVMDSMYRGNIVKLM
jgi:hypothetical protein